MIRYGNSPAGSLNPHHSASDKDKLRGCHSARSGQVLSDPNLPELDPKLKMLSLGFGWAASG